MKTIATTVVILTCAATAFILTLYILTLAASASAAEPTQTTDARKAPAPIVLGKSMGSCVDGPRVPDRPERIGRRPLTRY